MSVEIKIKKRDRDYGLLTWGKSDDFEIMTIFGKKEYLPFSICGSEPKTKKFLTNIDA